MNVFLRAALMLALAAPAAFAENLLKNGSFEEPKVDGRVDATKGASPAITEETSWARFQSRDETGKVSVGMTSELARTGKQSIYVQFDQAEKTKGAILLPRLIPIKGGKTYRLSLWGRVDRKRPLTLDQGRPYMTVEVDFYPADGGIRVGDPEFRTQMIPGMSGNLLFISSRWSEYYAEFKAPVLSDSMRIILNWESPRREGAADGIIYFDDAALEVVPESPEAPAAAPEVDGKPRAAGEARLPVAPATPVPAPPAPR